MTIKIMALSEGDDPSALAVREVGLPTPGDHEVTIAVRAAGVNPTDWKTTSRMWPRDAHLPVGHEASGIVSAVGAAVDRITVGDEVIAFPVVGAWASDVVAAADDVFPKPATLDFAQAANLLLVGTTAAEMLEVVGVGAGDTVVLHGGSAATGVSFLQQAARFSARVIATASPRNHDLVRGFGGEPVIYGRRLGERLRDLAPEGFAAAFDCVGTEEALAVSLELVADRARIVTIASPDRAEELGIRFIGRNQASLEYRRAQRRPLVDMAARGELTVPMARTLPLTAAAEAFSILRSEHPGGKLALIP